jgi:hypothetical protein
MRLVACPSSHTGKKSCATACMAIVETACPSSMRSQSQAAIALIWRMKRRNKRFPSGPALAGALAFGLVMNAPTMANADEGGVTMWVPGFFGSLAAAPLQPGWALGTIYYHPSVDASGNVATARQITIGRFNPNLDLSLSASLQARPDLLLVVPSYVFATPVLGGKRRSCSCRAGAARRPPSTRR